MIIQPDKLVVETKDLAFAQSPAQNVQFQMECFQDLTTEVPIINVSAPNCPFSVSITSGTTEPILTIVLDKSIDNIKNGTVYNIVITANGVSQTVPLTFLFSENFNPVNWFNDAQNDLSSGQAFSFRELITPTGWTTSIFNIRFKMILEYVSLLQFKLTDILNRFETKRGVKDIVDCAINSGVFPKNCTAVVTRDVDGDTAILDLTYSSSDEAKTRAVYTYTTLPVIVDFSLAAAPYTQAAVTRQKKFLSGIEIWRMSSSGYKRYKICSVAFSRSNITIASTVGCNITIPAINGWTVSE